MRLMIRIKVKQNQTLFDIAIEQYGTCEAVEELLRLNPDISNDPRAKIASGIDYIADRDFYLDLAVAQGEELIINLDSELRQNTILREIQGIDITTYNNGTNN